MAKYLFLEYPKCSTCRKARAFLETHGIDFEARHIVENPPTADELRTWIARAGVPAHKCFNTSGLRYKALALKDKLPAMSEEDQIALLASDGMLVKRPVLVSADGARFGFRNWETLSGTASATFPSTALRAWNDTSPDTKTFRAIFDISFPHEEKRADEDWNAALADPICNARLFRADGNAHAILVFWDFGYCRYVEYFALAPDARGSGLGSRLLREFLAESAVPVVLEIEPPEDETTTRRLRFYERLGFKRDAREHFHPPYHAGFGRQRLVVLNSSGKPLPPNTRERFERDIEMRAMRDVPAARAS